MHVGMQMRAADLLATAKNNWHFSALVISLPRRAQSSEQNVGCSVHEQSSVGPTGTDRSYPNSVPPSALSRVESHHARSAAIDFLISRSSSNGGHSQRGCGICLAVTATVLQSIPAEPRRLRRTTAQRTFSKQLGGRWRQWWWRQWQRRRRLGRAGRVGPIPVAWG